VEILKSNVIRRCPHCQDEGLKIERKPFGQSGDIWQKTYVCGSCHLMVFVKVRVAPRSDLMPKWICEMCKKETKTLYFKENLQLCDQCNKDWEESIREYQKNTGKQYE
jgi:hypothetical protein